MSPKKPQKSSNNVFQGRVRTITHEDSISIKTGLDEILLRFDQIKKEIRAICRGYAMIREQYERYQHTKT